MPESASIPVEPCTASGVGEVLAGEASRDELDALELLADVAHVSDDAQLGSSACEHASACVVNLAAPCGDESRAFEAEVEPVAAGEERPAEHVTRPPARLPALRAREGT